MHPQLVKQWTDALRSGEYKQGREYLRAGDEFCCLGVLCDIVQPDKWSPKKWDPDFNFAEAIRHRGASSYPSSELMDEIGLEFSFVEDLAKMNDIDRADFYEIADVIEKHYGEKW